MRRPHDGPVKPAKCVGNCGKAIEVAGVLRAMYRCEVVPAGWEIDEPVERIHPRRSLGEISRCVEHDVPREDDTVCDSLLSQVFDRRGCRAEQSIRHMIRQHAVDFLGHLSVERSQARSTCAMGMPILAATSAPASVLL